MLLTLILENFKKHAYLKVDFTAGTNGIYGSNYRGKTTLLNGILFALGGSSHVPGNRLHRIGADGPMKVSLTFALGGTEYQVVRTKSTANLFKGGAVIATSSSAVTNEIENLIGMTIKEWKELHYAKQKNAHSLLRYSANNLAGATRDNAIQTRVASLEGSRTSVLGMARSDRADLARRCDERRAQELKRQADRDAARSDTP